MGIFKRTKSHTGMVGDGLFTASEREHVDALWRLTACPALSSTRPTAPCSSGAGVAWQRRAVRWRDSAWTEPVDVEEERFLWEVARLKVEIRRLKLEMKLSVLKVVIATMGVFSGIAALIKGFDWLV